MRLPWAPQVNAVPTLFGVFAGASVLASSTNRTIDDQKGDSVTGRLPTYSPTDSWNVGPQCTSDSGPNACHVHLETSECFDGTWHDGTSGPELRSVTALFTGTAVYVYGILANTVPFTHTVTNLTFQLDGVQVGSFLHVPTNSTDYQYNALLYANSSIPNGDHIIVIETNGNTDFFLILFDYIVYTFVDEPPPSDSPPSSPPSTSAAASPSFTKTSAARPTDIPISASDGPQSPSGSSITLLPSPGVSSLASPAAGLQDIPAHHHVPVGDVIGGTIGGIIAVILFLMLLRHYMGRASKRRPPRTGPVRPAAQRLDSSDLISSGRDLECANAPVAIASTLHPRDVEAAVDSGGTSSRWRGNVLPQSYLAGEHLSSEGNASRNDLSHIPASRNNTRHPSTGEVVSSSSTQEASLQRDPISQRHQTQASHQPPRPLFHTPALAALRTQMNMLQGEVVRIREEQLVQRELSDAPPQYLPEDAR